MNLGRRLRRARKARELTQEELAELVPGSNQAMISALETRDSENTILLFEFADALRVNPRWLLTGGSESGLPSDTGKTEPKRMSKQPTAQATAPDSRTLRKEKL